LNNDCNNTKMNAGFWLLKNTALGRQMLRTWWDEASQERGIYRIAPFHEQRIWNDYCRQRYKGSWTEAEDPDDYNTPDGIHLAHFWFKDQIPVQQLWEKLHSQEANQGTCSRNLETSV